MTTASRNRYIDLSRTLCITFSSERFQDFSLFRIFISLNQFENWRAGYFSTSCYSEIIIGLCERVSLSVQLNYGKVFRRRHSSASNETLRGPIGFSRDTFPAPSSPHWNRPDEKYLPRAPVRFRSIRRCDTDSPFDASLLSPPETRIR